MNMLMHTLREHPIDIFVPLLCLMALFWWSTRDARVSQANSPKAQAPRKPVTPVDPPKGA